MARRTFFSLFVLLTFGLTGPALAADETHWTIKSQAAATFDWRGAENIGAKKIVNGREVPSK